MHSCDLPSSGSRRQSETSQAMQRLSYNCWHPAINTDLSVILDAPQNPSGHTKDNSQICFKNETLVQCYLTGHNDDSVILKLQGAIDIRDLLCGLSLSTGKNGED